MHETISTNYLASFVTWGGPPSHRLRSIPTYSAKRIAVVREAVIKVVTPYVPHQFMMKHYRRIQNPQCI